MGKPERVLDWPGTPRSGEAAERASALLEEILTCHDCQRHPRIGLKVGIGVRNRVTGEGRDQLVDVDACLRHGSRLVEAVEGEAGLRRLEKFERESP